MRKTNLLLLVVAISALMLSPIAGTEAGKDYPSTSDLKAAEPGIETDKYTYCTGETVYITITGPASGGSTEYGMGYIVKDENGDWARIYYLSLEDDWSSEDPQYYTWDQTYWVEAEYDPLGNYNIHYSQNGEQVSQGKYYIYSAISDAGPVEIEIVECAPEPEPTPIVTTDKYTYCIGEPVNITVTGHIKVSSGTWLQRGYVVKDDAGKWARDPPQVGTDDYHKFDGPVYFTWNQKYDVMYEYDIDGNYQVHYPENGKQVSPGKYYIHSFAEGFVEIVVVECSKLTIEKVKISGPDEVYTHTYNEWELKITVTAMHPPGSGINSVNVYDVLPAELELLQWTASQGTLSIDKPGNGKMGSTHLTWDVGYLGCWIGNTAELVLKIATKENPAGKMEFTSPGTYLLNEGATATGIDPTTGEEMNAGPTQSIAVNATDLNGLCRKNIQYRNPHFQPNDAFIGIHIDCAWGFVNYYYNSEGEMVSIESYIDEEGVSWEESLSARMRSAGPIQTFSLPMTPSQSIAQGGAGNGSGLGAVPFILSIQILAFGVVLCSSSKDGRRIKKAD